ncbi:MAG: MlaD family protein [Myxococcota bacterium]
MKGDRWLSLVVGSFMIVALGAFAVVILSLSAERGIWVPRYHLVAHFENVQGLISGAPVWLAGKQVGTTESVSFGESGAGRPPVRVVLQVDEVVRERIRSDSMATIGTIGLLGDRYVEISMGTREGTVLEDGAELRALQPLSLDDVVRKGVTALDGITTLASNVNGVVEAFSQEMGAQKVASAVGAASEMIEEVRRGEGLLHSVIYDRYEGGGVESIERSLATLENILVEIREGQGLLHALIYESPTDQSAVMQMAQASARLNSILSKVDQGEGSLGLMLNDPTLYEDLKQLVGGAQRSLVLRTLIGMAVDE